MNTVNRIGLLFLLIGNSLFWNTLDKQPLFIPIFLMTLGGAMFVVDWGD